MVYNSAVNTIISYGILLTNSVCSYDEKKLVLNAVNNALNELKEDRNHFYATRGNSINDFVATDSYVDGAIQKIRIICIK